MRFTIGAATGDGGDELAATVDVHLVGSAADATVDELVDAATGLEPALARAGRGRLQLDDVAIAGSARIADVALRAGSLLRILPPASAGPGGAREPTGRAGVGMELVTLAGPDSGLVLRLRPGRYRLGRGDQAGLRRGRVDVPAVRLDLDERGGTVRAEDAAAFTVVDAVEVRVDGQPLAGTGSGAEGGNRGGAGSEAGGGSAAGGEAVVGPGSVIAVEDTVFRLRTATPPEYAVALGEVDGQGRQPLIRTPRVAALAGPEAVAVPAYPAPAATPAPMSWLVMLAPLPVGVVMALVFSPFFLIMTAMTPLMTLARWVEGRYRARRDARRIARELAEAGVRFAADVDRARAAAAGAARATQRDLAELDHRSRSGRELWEVRPGDPDAMRVGLGVGAVPWWPDLGRAGDAGPGRPQLGSHLAGVLAERARLVDVPIQVDLRQRTGVGVVGPAGPARTVVAALLLELVTRHGPADLELALVVAPEAVPAWEWAKWLPHLATADGGLRLATDPEAAAALLTGMVPPDGPRGVTRTDVATGHAVVVVDGDAMLTGPVASLLGRLARGPGRALVLASQVERLPSVCRSFVELAADGTATMTDAVTGDRFPGLLATQAAGQVCRGTARALARWSDPERSAAAATLPDRVRLLDLLMAEAAEAEAPGRRLAALDAVAIGRGWRRPAPGLRAVIGRGAHGPLAVDLLADGPHGLVVGTTGSGKSELLRTIVTSLACHRSPDELTFLLVDFKGGGAFDACAGLPHTVGLVTDLDEHLAARALRCLRAELRHRERRLREEGVSDLADYPAAAPPLPRLMIVIDEFATLAVELPGFLSALVDVAQRGRSLGLHLLLATQRPQGVVDGKIRANTNLRVALRVQDEADSRDVLGSRLAADIGRRHPGRAYVRLGADEVVGFQSALVSAVTAQGTAVRVDLERFRLAPDPTPVPGTPPRPTAPGPGEAATAVPTDLETLVAAARSAARAGGYLPPRVPWPAPLPAQVDGWTLPATDPAAQEAAGDGAAAGGPAGDGAAGDGSAGGGPARAAWGVVDLPDEQRQDTWWWRPEDGATLVLGADPEATAAALAGACLALARARRPEELGVMVLDGQTGGLAALAGLPHVRAAVGVDDVERLARVLDQLDGEVTRRRAAAEPDRTAVVVIVAGWSAVVDGAERAGLADTGARLERLARDGAAAGVHLLLSAPHERALPGRVFAQVSTRLCLRLADPASYTSLGLRVRDLPDLRGLRAIALPAQQEIHLAQFGPGPEALGAAVARVAADYPHAPAAPTVGVLPELIAAAEVIGESAWTANSWRLAIGRRYRDLAAATLNLSAGMHAVVAGPPGSGRTSALRTIAAAARIAVPGAIISVVATDPTGWDPGSVTELVGSLDRLTAWPGAGQGLLIIDGVELLGPAAGPNLDRLFAAAPVAGHIVLGGRPDALRGMQPWQRAVTMSRTGLLLRPAPDDGDVLRVRIPREVPLRPVPGRGYLVDAGGATQIQVARLPQAETLVLSSEGPR